MILLMVQVLHCLIRTLNYGKYGIFLLNILNYGNYGIFFIMGNAGFIPSTVAVRASRLKKAGQGFIFFGLVQAFSMVMNPPWPQ